MEITPIRLQQGNISEKICVLPTTVLENIIVQTYTSPSPSFELQMFTSDRPVLDFRTAGSGPAEGICVIRSQVLCSHWSDWSRRCRPLRTHDTPTLLTA